MNLASTIGRHLDQADEGSPKRESMFDRYMGEPRGDEVKGRSQIVTSEVFDVVESVTAEVMDIVAGEQAVASFLPMSAEDEIQAQDETDACNRLFWEENDGFNLLQTSLRSGLIEQNGYVRRGWVSEQVVNIDEYSGMTVEQAQSIGMRYVDDPDIEEIEILEIEGVDVIETDGGPDQYMPTGGEIKAKVRCVKNVDRLEIEPLPFESVMMTPRWHKISLQDIPFVAIKHTEMTRSDYLAMGFSEESVAGLKNEAQSTEQDNRDNTKHNDKSHEERNADDAMETVVAYECFVLADDDGDGIAERLHVWMSSDRKTMMMWEDDSEAKEEVDGVPISAWTPIPVPNRHVGRSLAEVVEDLQSIGTVLSRQVLDNVYATNYARPVVSSDQSTKDTFTDLATPDHGAAIRVTGPAQTAIAWQMPPSIVGSVLPLLDKVAQAKEERTGVTRLSQGLDQNTLNKTASGQAMLLTQGQKRLKLIVRNFAEFVRDIFVGMHRDLRKGNLREINYMTGGAWQAQSPVDWPDRRAMRVSIGTGNGDRQEKQQTLSMIGQVQRELMASGSPMVNEAKLFATIDRMVRIGGYQGASTFFNDPNGDVYQQAMANKPPPKPDPAEILATAEAKKAEAQAAKAEADALLKLEEIQHAARENERRHQERMLELQIKAKQVELNEIKAAADIQTKGEAQDLAEKAQADDIAHKYDKLAVDALT